MPSTPPSPAWRNPHTWELTTGDVVSVTAYGVTATGDVVETYHRSGIEYVVVRFIAPAFVADRTQSVPLHAGGAPCPMVQIDALAAPGGTLDEED